MYYRAFFGTITMLGLAALIGMFAVLSSPLAPPSPAYAQSNNPPTFSEETDTRDVAENTPAREDIGVAVSANDGDGDSDRFTYTLSGTDAAAFDIVRSSGQLRTKAALDHEIKGSYTVTVTATGRSGAFDTINVTINVTNVDEEGTVTLSSRQPQVGTELTATLTDPDSDITGVTWEWELSSDRSSGWADAVTSATFIPGTDDVGKYLRATATYGGGGNTPSAVSDRQVRAAPADNAKPSFRGNTATRSVAENAAADTNIGTPVTAADTDKLTYTLGGTDADSFDIDETSGQLLTVDGLDYESKSSYSVTVTATDPSGASDTITVTIEVTNVDEPGTVTLSSSQPQEGTALTATLDDPDGVSGNITWKWAKADSTDGPFTPITASRSNTLTPGTGDLGKFLWAMATYGDGEGSNKAAMKVVTIAVRAGQEDNSPPSFTDGDTVTRSVAENAAATDIGAPVKADDSDAGDGDKLRYTLSGTDATAFGIDAATGRLQTKSALDYETKSSYSVTVTATDPSGASDTIAVTITVTNADDEGKVTLSSTQPQVGTPLTATLTDPDGDVTDLTWQWEVSDDAAGGSFTLINGATSATFTPGTRDVEKHLKATASYTDGEGDGSTKTAKEVTVNVVRVAGEPPSDSIAPAFAESTATRSVAENTAAATNIGAPVTATDADTDSGDTLTYSLSGRDAASFAIIALSGQLQTKTALDYETKSRYSVTVTATDLSGASDSITVIITVTNVNEASEVTGPTAKSYPENGTGTVASYRASDPEGQSVTWSLSGTDRGDFSISTTGKLTFKTPPDYEAPADANRDNNYLVRVRADDGSHIGDLAVTVTVTHQNEAPIVTGNADVSYPEAGTGVVGAYSATDDDGASVTWSLSGTDRGDFSISATGVLTFRNPPNFEAPADANRNNEYRVTVRANDGATTGTTAVKVTVTDVNEPPSFPEATVALTIAENTVAGRNIGGRIVAADPDRDSALTYTLGGSNAASFAIVAASGQLQTKAGLNYEGKASYTVTVSVSDGRNSRGNADTRVDDSTTVTVTVTDRNEAPGKPAAPAVTPASSGGHAALEVSWLAPTNIGPDITGYAVEYRKQGAASWRADNVAVSGARATINAVTPDTAYEARVRARNAENTGQWSDPGRGRTAATPTSRQIQLAVNYQSQAYAVREGGAIDVTVILSAPADRDLQIPITVTMRTAETEDYQVSGLSDAALSFAPGESSQRFSFQALQDSDLRTDTVDLGFGQLPSKVVAGGSDTARVSINDDDRVIPPTPMPMPTPAPAAAVGAGDGLPSNRAPVFTEGVRATRSVAEDTGYAIYIGKPVAATDADEDRLTYSLGGVDGASFAVDKASGQLITEAPLDFATQAAYVLLLKVSDGRGASDVIFVTINLIDLPEMSLDNPLTQTMGRAVPDLEPTVKAPAAPVQPTPEPVATAFPAAMSVSVADVPEPLRPALPAPQQEESGKSALWPIVMMVSGMGLLVSGGGFYLITRQRRQRQWR